MESHNIHKGIQDVHEVSLSKNEKIVMWNRLHEYATSKPPAPAKLIKSPWLFTPRLAFAFSWVLIIVAVGYGTVSAAEGSVPGDILYPIKIKVTEPIRDALVTDTNAKVAWEVEKVDRRLQEAQTLKSEGKLTAATKAELTKQIDTHVATLVGLEATSSESDDGGEDTVEVAVANRMSAKKSPQAPVMATLSMQVQVEDHSATSTATTTEKHKKQNKKADLLERVRKFEEEDIIEVKNSDNPGKHKGRDR